MLLFQVLFDFNESVVLAMFPYVLDNQWGLLKELMHIIKMLLSMGLLDASGVPENLCISLRKRIATMDLLL